MGLMLLLSTGIDSCKQPSGYPCANSPDRYLNGSELERFYALTDTVYKPFRFRGCQLNLVRDSLVGDCVHYTINPMTAHYFTHRCSIKNCAGTLVLVEDFPEGNLR